MFSNLVKFGSKLILSGDSNFMLVFKITMYTKNKIKQTRVNRGVTIIFNIDRLLLLCVILIVTAYTVTMRLIQECFFLKSSLEWSTNAFL